MKPILLAGLIALTTALTPVSRVEAQELGVETLELYQSYLDLAEQFVGFTTEQEATVFLAVEGIAEIYEARGEQAAAIPVLEAALDQYPDDLAARNIIRFKLRDLYNETGQAEQALAQLQAVLAENS